MKTNFRPYHLLGVLAVLLLVSSFFVLKKRIDIHLYDTFFVIVLAYIHWLFSAFLFSLWVLYRFTNSFLYSTFLSWTHITLSILIVIFIVTIPWWPGNFYSGSPRRYFDDDDWQSFISFQNANLCIIISVIILLFVQLVYVINIICGIIKSKKLN